MIALTGYEIPALQAWLAYQKTLMDCVLCYQNRGNRLI